MISRKPIAVVALEALVVGIGLVALHFFIERGISGAPTVVLFLSGVMFHVLFEYTGLNEIYAIDYCAR